MYIGSAGARADQDFQDRSTFRLVPCVESDILDLLLLVDFLERH